MSKISKDSLLLFCPTEENKGETIVFDKKIRHDLYEDEKGYHWMKMNRQGNFTWWHSHSRMLIGLSFIGYSVLILDKV